MKQASDCWALLSFRRFLIQRVEIGSGSHSNVLEKAPTLFSFCFETELNVKLVDKLQSKWMYGQLTPENSKVGFLLESCSQLFWSQDFHLDVASKARRKDCRYKSKNCEARHSHAWQQDFLVFALHILSLPWFGSLPPLWEFLSLLRLVYPPLMCSSAVKPPPHWTGFMFRLTHPLTHPANSRESSLLQMHHPFFRICLGKPGESRKHCKTTNAAFVRKTNCFFEWDSYLCWLMTS